MYGITHSVDNSQPLSPVTLGITQWAQEHSSHGGRNGSETWTSKVKLGMFSPECPICQQQGPTQIPQYGTILTTEEHFHHRRGSVLSLLEYILILDMDLPSLHAVLLPKLPSVDIQNALSIVRLFCTELFLTKELTSQQMKCGSGPVIMEFKGLPMFPSILKQVA